MITIIFLITICIILFILARSKKIASYKENKFWVGMLNGACQE